VSRRVYVDHAAGGVVLDGVARRGGQEMRRVGLRREWEESSAGLRSVSVRLAIGE